MRLQLDILNIKVLNLETGHESLTGSIYQPPRASGIPERRQKAEPC